MAATEKWAAQATFARLRNKGIPAADIAIPNVLALVSAALKKMAVMRPDLFQQETTVVTLMAGVASLQPLEDNGFLTETIDKGQIFHANSVYPLQPLEDEAQLQFPWPNAVIYYCLSQNSIKTRNTDGSLTSLTGPLRMTATKVPSISQIDAPIQSDFIDIMEALAIPATTKKK